MPLRVIQPSHYNNAYITSNTSTVVLLTKNTNSVIFFLNYNFKIFSSTDQDISKLQTFIRSTFAEATFPPKLHMLEDHVINFIRRWHFPLGFFGEQGGQSIHHEFVEFANDFHHVHPATDRLKGMLERHYTVVEPENREIIPVKKPRNLKRKR